jgi:7-cyano-7-deazaguanine reductase
MTEKRILRLLRDHQMMTKTKNAEMTRMTQKSDLDGLTLLGRGAKPTKKLETFPNHHPERDYIITLRTEEFTCVCPATGQPDFAKLTIQYMPDKKIIESKSLKLYLQSFRNKGAFHEHVTNVILDDLVAALEPRWCKVTADFAVRGGISITAEAESKK